MRFSSLLLPVLVFLLSEAGEAAGVKDPVTRLGCTALAKSDLVVRGSVVRSTRLPVGASVVRFRVQAVLFGHEASAETTLLSEESGFFPPADVPCILFLARLADGRYSPVQKVSLEGAEGVAREKVLGAYLAIEIQDDAAAKRVALRDLLLENLRSGVPFLVYSAARELAHFTQENGAVFTAEQAAEIRKDSEETTDPLLKELLDDARARMPVVPAPPEGGTAPEPEGPVAPVPPEFSILLAAWKEGIADPVRRHLVVTTVCARHLKRAAEILLSAIEDPDAAIREIAARELGEAGVGGAVSPLLRLLGREKEIAVRRSAIQSLGVLRAEGALDALLPFAEDPGLVRAVACAAARIGGTRAIEFLEALGASRKESAPELAKYVEFLLSPAFAAQEAALVKVRAARLR